MRKVKVKPEGNDSLGVAFSDLFKAYQKRKDRATAEPASAAKQIQQENANNSTLVISFKSEETNSNSLQFGSDSSQKQQIQQQ